MVCLVCWLVTNLISRLFYNYVFLMP
jgi:hypothetical protein